MIIKDFLLKRRWIILTFSFAVVTLATAAYLMYREIYRPKKPNAILARYGYLFRQEIDLDVLEQVIQSQESVPVNETENTLNETCKLSCTKKNQYQNAPPGGSTDRNITVNPESVNSEMSNDTRWGRYNYTDIYDEPRAKPQVQAQKIQYSYHGCCRSHRNFTSPHSLEHAINGKRLRIIQFKNKKQYFLTDVCEHVKNCDRNCECKQQMVIAVALVVDGVSTNEDFDENSSNNYDEMNARIELVKYPGWCKCFNT